MTKKQKIGIALILVPPVAFILTLAGYSIAAFTAAQIAAGAPANATAGTEVANAVRVVLGLVGLVSLIGTPVGFIVGLVFLVTGGEKTAAASPPPEPPAAPAEPTSAPTVPPASPSA